MIGYTFFGWSIKRTRKNWGCEVQYVYQFIISQKKKRESFYRWKSRITPKNWHQENDGWHPSIPRGLKIFLWENLERNEGLTIKGRLCTLRYQTVVTLRQLYANNDITQTQFALSQSVSWSHVVKRVVWF